jgi:hypothetical protein
MEPDREATIGVGRWALSFPCAIRLLVTGHIHLVPERVGTPLRMSDGRTYTPFRETRKRDSEWAGKDAAVLQARFHLRTMRPGQHRRYALFRTVCIVTTPFFVGLRGFRSKLWMEDPATGDFAGLYEWDDDGVASAYARGLNRILRWLSVSGSVSAEVVAHTTVDAYLEESRRGPSPLPSRPGPADDEHERQPERVS